MNEIAINNGYKEIRCGIVPPMMLTRIPGYFLAIGVKNDRLGFLLEFEEPNPVKFIENVIALENELRYHMLYTIMKTSGTLTDSFFINLYKACKDAIPWIQIVPAPYSEDINQGINLFSKVMYNNAFDPPPEDTVLYQHLKIQADIEPDDNNYGFHALRYVLGGISIQPRLDIEGIGQSRSDWQKAKKKNDLTGMSKAAWNELQEVRKEQRESEELWT